MKRLILGVAAALLLSAGPAAADGLPSKGRVAGPVAAAGPNWNGFYVGVGIGAGAVVHKDRYSEYDYGHLEYSETFDGHGGEGIFGTVTIGYDRVIRPGWVAGVFADYDFASNISTTYREHEIGYDPESYSIDHENTFSVGGRLGFLTNPSTLLYATAGYTQADFELGDYFTYNGGSETFSGYFVGAGIETFLRDNWTLKLEYRFSQFGEETVDADTEGRYTDRETIEPSMHTARAVLSYRFGHRD